MNHEENKSDSKSRYEPPQLVTINLRPEEAVLGHCKNASSSGPAAGGCAIILGGCQSLGS